jgi:hypothetical protein
MDKLQNIGIRRIYYSIEDKTNILTVQEHADKIPNNLKMEKVNEMESSHVSARFKRPWSQFEEHRKTCKSCKL